MKTISNLRKEVLRDHLTKEIKENEANLYELNKQLIGLDPEKELCRSANAKYDQKVGSENDPTQIPLQIGLLMDNISTLQTKLNIIQRNIVKSY